MRLIYLPNQTSATYEIEQFLLLGITRNIVQGNTNNLLGGFFQVIASSRGTAWGLLNSVTEYVDHHRRARSDDHRREAAWFGQGAQFKQRAWDELVQLAA